MKEVALSLIDFMKANPIGTFIVLVLVVFGIFTSVESCHQHSHQTNMLQEGK